MQKIKGTITKVAITCYGIANMNQIHKPLLQAARKLGQPKHPFSRANSCRSYRCRFCYAAQKVSQIDFGIAKVEVYFVCVPYATSCTQARSRFCDFDTRLGTFTLTHPLGLSCCYEAGQIHVPHPLGVGSVRDHLSIADASTACEASVMARLGLSEHGMRKCDRLFCVESTQFPMICRKQHASLSL